MSSQAAKRKLLEAMRAGRVAHESRGAQEEKNKLAVGDLSLQDATAMMGAARGPGEYRPHEMVPGLMVWIVRPEISGVRWYVKFYFVEDEAIFISFHVSEVKKKR